MAQLTLKGNPINSSGSLPEVGAAATDFTLVANDLSDATLATFSGKKKILSIFPSVDTGTCATSIRTFNEKAASLGDTVVLNISADLPFAQSRFCGAEGIDNVQTLSSFRSTFSNDYGLTFSDGPLAGLCSRAIIVLDENNTVLHTEQVTEITEEPNYDAALAAIT